MNEILSQISNLYETLKKKTEETETLLALAKDKLFDLSKKENELKDFQNALATRESNVGVVENLKAMQIQVAQEKNDAQAEVALAKEEAAKIDADVAERKRKSDADYKNFLSCDENLKRREKELADALTKLDADKKTYKDWVVKNMDKV